MKEQMNEIDNENKKKWKRKMQECIHEWWMMNTKLIAR